ncbi:MAG: hypothetical protein IKQ39_02895 [Oscillospiraceae bacterium]|nr:hypothetical protein [Oscillospiraceae bacterium]
MQKAKVSQLFLLFTGLQHACAFDDLIDSAMMQVRSMLREDADDSDVRLCYLAAAAANLQYRQMIAARTVCSPTYAGDSAVQHSDTAACALAERLAAEYRAAAAPLLRDDAFVFGTAASLCAGECP